MRLVKRQEFMQLPAGTLFAPMHQKWVFGDLAVKGDTWQHGNEIGDFLELGLNWIDGDDTGQVIDRLDEMLADSSVSYPSQSAYSREGLFDNDMVYLVYEPADVAALLAEINPARIRDQRVAVVQGVVVASINTLGTALLGADFTPIEVSPIPDAEVASMLAESIHASAQEQGGG